MRFTGENDQIKAVIDTVSAAAKKCGIYVIDRGGDREILFNNLLDNGVRFIIRLIGDRTLLWRNKTLIAEKLTVKCLMRHAETVRRETEESERSHEIQCGAMEVRLPGRDEPLRLVVVRGFGEKRMLLLEPRSHLTPTLLWSLQLGLARRTRLLLRRARADKEAALPHTLLSEQGKDRRGHVRGARRVYSVKSNRSKYFFHAGLFASLEALSE